MARCGQAGVGMARLGGVWRGSEWRGGLWRGVARSTEGRKMPDDAEIEESEPICQSCAMVLPSMDAPCPRCVPDAPQPGEARGDFLQSALAASEKRNFALAANQCHAPWNDEYGNHRCHIEDCLRETQSALAASQAEVRHIEGRLRVLCNELDASKAEVARLRELANEYAYEWAREDVTRLRWTTGAGEDQEAARDFAERITTDECVRVHGSCACRNQNENPLNVPHTICRRQAEVAHAAFAAARAQGERHRVF